MSRTPMTLGELIINLQKHPRNLPVMFEFDNFCPEAFRSYLREPSHLALGYQSCMTEDRPKVAELLELAEDAMCRTFDGYSGDCYEMHGLTPIWIAQWGGCTDTGLKKVKRYGDTIFLRTRHFPQGEISW